MKAFVTIATLAAVIAIAYANIEEIIGLDGHAIHHGHGVHHGPISYASITRGYHSLVQPDSAIRGVNFLVAPKNGFQAKGTEKVVADHPHIKIVRVVGHQGINGGSLLG